MWNRGVQCGEVRQLKAEQGIDLTTCVETCLSCSFAVPAYKPKRRKLVTPNLKNARFSCNFQQIKMLNLDTKYLSTLAGTGVAGNATGRYPLCLPLVSCVSCCASQTERCKEKLWGFLCSATSAFIKSKHSRVICSSLQARRSLKPSSRSHAG